MKFKKMLKESARLANEEWLNNLPNEPEKHNFSERFEWRIRKIPEQHFVPTPLWVKQVPKYAVTFLLFGLCSSGLLFATSVNARNSIVEWFEENILHINYQGNNYLSGLVFEPTWIPDGYVFRETIELENMTFLDYYNEKEENLTLFYFKGTTSADLQIESDAVFRRVRIQNNPGYVQLFETNAVKNQITWFDEKNNIIFTILGPLSENDLIRMAESVTKQTP